MAKVQITSSLAEEIKKRFGGESRKVADLIGTLEENPHKGKLLTQINGILIKEIRYKSFRFYFIIDGPKLKVANEKDLIDILIKFVAMSDKKSQQKTIEEIKKLLRSFGMEALK